MGGDAMSDDELDAAFAAGHDDSLRLTYQRYGALVHTLCRRILDPATSADVTQEVFVTLWRARRRYEPSRGTLAAWLMTITRHKLIDHLRATSRRPVSAGREPAHLAHQVAEIGSGELDAVIDRLLLADGLARLSPRARGVVELAFWSDLTQAQIAERRGLPLGTVKSDLRRSLAQLSRHLRPAGPAGAPPMQPGCDDA